MVLDYTAIGSLKGNKFTCNIEGWPPTNSQYAIGRSRVLKYRPAYQDLR